MKRKKLVIISHTNHYQDGASVKGWGPTISEINFLADYWDEIIHIGCLNIGEVPSSSLPYTKSNIKFVAIPPYGGKSLISKVLIFSKIPKIIAAVLKNIKDASEVQLRLPTSMGLFLLPLFSFFIARKFIFWVKYAGNWGSASQPLSYRLQKNWLQKNYAKCNVTINGFWPNQPFHCHSFENPCLTEQDILSGKSVALQKDFSGGFEFVFVGRLENAKGVQRIIEALRTVPQDTIKMVHFVGDGPKKEEYLAQLDFLKDKFKFHGFLGREEVHKVLAVSHFFLLPSASEGFPKALAEAACYGVIPVVSDVGSIPHYINVSNGFVWEIGGERSFGQVLLSALEATPVELKDISNNITRVGKMFTFENYYAKLSHLIES